jgi:integrase
LKEKVERLSSKSGGAISFAEIAQQWLDRTCATLKPMSRKRREVAIKALKLHFQTSVRTIAKSHIEIWAAKRSKQVAPRSFNMELETLALIPGYAAREGLILDNPTTVVPHMKLPKAKIIIPTKAQFATLIGQMRAKPFAAEAADFCELLGYSGCRLAEAAAMTWGDVNLDLNNFTVTGGEAGTKNLEARTVPLFPPLERLLLTMRKSLPETPRPEARIFGILSAKKAMATACKKATLPHFTHHSLRHFFCSNAIEAGADFKVIAGWLGHKDGGILVARTYGHLRDEHSTMMAQRMTFDLAKPDNEPANVVRMATATA